MKKAGERPCLRLCPSGPQAGQPAWPVSLSPGATLGVFAPSGPYDRVQLEKGAALWLRAGFRLKKAPGLQRRRKYLAGSDEYRLRILTQLMEDPEVDGLLAARGGYGVTRLLPALDDLWNSWPAKPVIGFSDLTAFHLARFKTAGIIGIHGPMLTSLAGSDILAVTETLACLEYGFWSSWRWSFHQASVLQAGRVSGPLLGGNLTLVNQMLAGPYLPDFSGAILMLEEVGEEPYRLDRMLTSLRQSPLWGKAAGLVFGSFAGCGPPAEVRRLLREAADAFSGPVVGGAPFGHGTANRPWPLGAWAELNLL